MAVGNYEIKSLFNRTNGRMRGRFAGELPILLGESIRERERESNHNCIELSNTVMNKKHE